MQKFSEQKVYEVCNAKYVLNEQDLLIVDEVWNQDVYHLPPLRGMQVLDIGAHKGIFTVYCLLMGAMVDAYEPDPDNFRTLLLNVNMNSGPGHCYPKGVWGHSESKILYKSSIWSAGNSVFVDNPEIEDKHVACEFISLDKAIGQYVWDVVKIDCEGSEYEILTGCSDESLKRIKFITMELHSWRPVELHDKLVARLEKFFDLDGVKEANGRYGYLWGPSKS